MIPAEPTVAGGEFAEFYSVKLCLRSRKFSTVNNLTDQCGSSGSEAIRNRSVLYVKYHTQCGMLRAKITFAEFQLAYTTLPGSISEL